MNPGRGALVGGVGIVLVVALIWLTLPTVGAAGVVYTQVPVLDHILGEMGVDDRIQQVIKYISWGLMAMTAHHCLTRKKHGFRRASFVTFGTVAACYLAWYVNDHWLAGIKPIDITQPEMQAQAFDAYNGTPNLCATQGLIGGEHVYWKNVKVDPLTGLPTHLLNSQEFQDLLNQKRAGVKRTQELSDLQSQNVALQQKLNDLKVQCTTLQHNLADSSDSARQSQDLLKQQGQQSAEAQARNQNLQQLLDAERSQEAARPQAVGVETHSAQPLPMAIPEDSPPPVGPFVQQLRPGFWLRVPLTGIHMQFWSNGPIEFGMPPQMTKQVYEGPLRVSGNLGALAMIRPLSPEATTVWYRNVDDQHPR